MVLPNKGIGMIEIYRNEIGELVSHGETEESPLSFF